MHLRELSRCRWQQPGLLLGPYPRVRSTRLRRPQRLVRLEVAPGLFLEDPSEQVLAEIKSQREANPLTGYFPHSQQLPFHEAIGAKTPIVAFFGGNRSGKTHCSVADDLIQALPKEWVPEHLLPYKRWDPPFHMW